MSQIGATIENAPAEPLPVDATERRRQGTLRATLGRVLRQRSAVIGLAILAFLFTVALLAPVLATHDPIKPMLGIEPGAKPRLPPCIHLAGLPSRPARALLWARRQRPRRLQSRVLRRSRFADGRLRDGRFGRSSWARSSAPSQVMPAAGRTTS